MNILKGFSEAAGHKMAPLSSLQVGQSFCRKPKFGIS